MDNYPTVTFIMPAYNVEKFIGEAIMSLQSQTIKDWKLTIIDDCSTDSTLKIARSFAEKDTRITVVQMDKPSGSAYQPRKKAIISAKTEWVAPLDADDWVEKNYLEKLLKQLLETGVDLIYPTMFRVIDRDDKGNIIAPRDKNIYKNIIKGRDCIKYTLCGWKINANGGIIRKSIYEEAYSRFDSSLTYFCADELLTRQLLFLAPNVAFSETKYYYRDNPTSITKRIDVGSFDFIINNIELIKFTEKFYGKKSEEYTLAQKQNFEGYFQGIKLLSHKGFSQDIKEAGKKLILMSRKSIDSNTLNNFPGWKYKLLYRTGFDFTKFVLKLIGNVN